MTELTKVEKELLQFVDVSRLRNSLSKIRDTVEDIWNTSDTLRIIQDYTDHGIAHSIRLVQFVSKLLAANHSQPLSADEMYILLAGIYLHDIGMQCDIIKFPEIQTRAEELGAKFEIEFGASTTSKFSIDEQKAIRKNHHYLTAAWIDYAFRTGKTILGPAIKDIHSDLVSDLMDVCKYHAKLRVADCPIYFRFNPTQRKRLIAALLRFADELDIDANRVSIETVKLFRLDPHNSLYWWLHNRTKVLFNAPNLILITIRLHPDDVVKQGILIHNIFIIGFQTKNQSILSILAENGIPLVISSESNVVDDEYAEPLPEEISQALSILYKQDQPRINLVDEMSIMLELSKAASSLVLPNTERFWDSVSNALELWRNKLDFEYVALFAGQTEGDKILTIKASSGLLPQTKGDILFPHFNWKKAGLREEEFGYQERGHNWTSVSFADRDWLIRGFRGGDSGIYSFCTGYVPVCLPGGPYGVLLLGPRLKKSELIVQEKVVLETTRDLGVRILSLYLARILNDARINWDNTARLVGHRVRSYIQSMNSQLSIINAVIKKEAGFTHEDQELAETYLNTAFSKLEEVSYMMELPTNVLDVEAANREFISLREIILGAIVNQQDMADTHDIKIEEDIHKLPIVHVNKTLMELAFIHLINNGLKYSLPHIDSHKRFLSIKSAYIKAGFTSVEVVNFGLGIKAEEIKNVFDWGTRFSSRTFRFRDVYGKGVGLWEARYIVEGHGGQITVRSIHHSGEPVTDENIQQCITVFTVSLPIASEHS